MEYVGEIKNIMQILCTISTVICAKVNFIATDMDLTLYLHDLIKIKNSGQSVNFFYYQTFN